MTSDAGEVQLPSHVHGTGEAICKELEDRQRVCFLLPSEANSSSLSPYLHRRILGSCGSAAFASYWMVMCISHYYAPATASETSSHSLAGAWPSCFRPFALVCPEGDVLNRRLHAALGSTLSCWRWSWIQRAVDLKHTRPRWRLQQIVRLSTQQLQRLPGLFTNRFGTLRQSEERQSLKNSDGTMCRG